MGLLSRWFGLDQVVRETIKESFSYLPGTPAMGTLDWPAYRPDRDGFLPTGFYRKRSATGDNPQAYLHDEDLRRAVETSRNLCVSNEYARNGLTNRRNYIVGTGFKTVAEAVDPDSPNEALLKQVNQWLQRYAVLTKRCEKEKESVFRGDRDGEVFIRLFKGTQVLEWRFVESEYVGNWDGNTPFGIKTDPQDITKVESYLVKSDEAKEYEVVPAEEMIHVKLNTDSGIKRGLPFLYPVFSILRKIESTNENMATTTAIMAAIAMIRRNPYQTKTAIDSNNASVADISVTGPFGATDNYKGYRAGTILDADANTEYEFPANSINLSGVVNCKQSLLQTAAAGMGLPEYMLTSDASNGNFASTQVAETPAIAGFLAMQHFWADVFGSGMWVEGADLGLTWRAIEYAVELGQLPAQALEEVALKTEGPNIEVRDKAAETNRHSILADKGILSRNQWAAKEGLSKAHKSDEEMEAKQQADMQAQMQLKQAGGKGLNEQFDEEKHPRDEGGKFTSGGMIDHANAAQASIKTHLKDFADDVAAGIESKNFPAYLGGIKAELEGMAEAYGVKTLHEGKPIEVEVDEEVKVKPGDARRQAASEIRDHLKDYANDLITSKKRGEPLDMALTLGAMAQSMSKIAAAHGTPLHGMKHLAEQFDEDQHPRDEAGKFASKGGEGVGWQSDKKKSMVNPKQTYYHGTNKNFKKFDPSKGGGWISFTPHEWHASNFGDKVIEVKLDVKNPIDLTGFDAETDATVDGEKLHSHLISLGFNLDKAKFKGDAESINDFLTPIRDEIKSQAIALGFDGIIRNDYKDGQTAEEVVVFDASQAKLQKSKVNPGKQKTRDAVNALDGWLSLPPAKREGVEGMIDAMSKADKEIDDHIVFSAKWILDEYKARQVGK